MRRYRTASTGTSVVGSWDMTVFRPTELEAAVIIAEGGPGGAAPSPGVTPG